MSAPEPHKLDYLPPEASARDARFLARGIAIFTAAWLPTYGAFAFEWFVWRVLAGEATSPERWSGRADYPSWALVLFLARLLVFPASAVFFAGLALTRRVWVWPLLAATIVVPGPVLANLWVFRASFSVGYVIKELAEAAAFVGLFILFLTPAFRRSVNAGK